ncbi:hypothetical protein FA13DRAFT_11091 [Coprinellus micaceus]|uniref:Uncharacterized protein n=1 Tax=Coprinellus micaceus TaxID=71717 RepID=A0A4Y7U010_COPMI|nr:hypothetical protein FA13DRAFT_11091 [Coprinellus micaceus]
MAKGGVLSIRGILRTRPRTAPRTRFALHERVSNAGSIRKRSVSVVGDTHFGVHNGHRRFRGNSLSGSHDYYYVFDRSEMAQVTLYCRDTLPHDQTDSRALDGSEPWRRLSICDIMLCCTQVTPLDSL